MVDDALLTFGAQSFYTYRIYVLSESVFLCLPGWVMIVGRVMCGMAAAVYAARMKTFPVFMLHCRWLVILGISANLALDGYNTLTLCFYLYSKRSRFRA